MKILVPVKRVVDYNVKTRFKADAWSLQDAAGPGWGSGRTQNESIALTAAEMARRADEA
ncbi:MAG: hypothetical protein AB7V13_02045 [Pseudorhodoplanes sp.]